MRLQRRTVYALEALFDMAFHAAGRAVQAREVAERQRIPPRYLEQVLQELRRAGLVDAKRGPGGGYALARPATEVRVHEVVAALEGPPASWLVPGEMEAGPGDPVTASLRDLAPRLGQVLAGVTLADLVARADAEGVPRAQPAAQMYFI